jgi:dTDP-4-dehydrorhamnose 3,5-epimerase
MIFKETKLSGAYVIEMEPFQDERGFFAEVWKDEIAAQYGIQAHFQRSNMSMNRKAGTLRGLHAQKAPYEEAKLVRCVQGACFDVIVDMRPESATYFQWTGIELSAENMRALFVPRGFLHGFQTLVDNTILFYQTDGKYERNAEVGARFDDPALNIQWPSAMERVLSPKDQAWPFLEVPVVSKA